MTDSGKNLVAQIFERAVSEGWGPRLSLCEGKRGLSYDELIVLVRKCAGLLQDAGVRAGERLAVYSPDCLDSAVVLLGAMYLGAVAVPLSELTSTSELAKRLEHADVRHIAVHPSLREKVESGRAKVPSLKTVLVLGEAEEDHLGQRLATAAGVDAVALAGDAPLALFFSAGAHHDGGEPGLRGVEHTHEAARLACASFAQHFLSLSGDDKVFSTVRLHTVYGFGIGLLFPLLAGAQSFLLAEQPHSSSVFASIESFSPTIFVATPSVYGQMARDATSLGKAKILAPLRYCIAGAEDMPPKVIAMVRGVLGNNVTVGYGLTEAFQFVIAGEAAGRRPGNCGQPLHGFELRIVDDEGSEVGVDEIGTLQLRSDHIARRYVGSETDLTDDGWFTTLDRFMVDDEGTYYHCGRVDHLFKVGGKWVAPAEVERALLAHEAVWECAVIGADDEDGLIKPFAFVVPNLGQEPGEELETSLRDYVKNELAPFKYPRWIEFVDELPKGAGGVILRYTLRDRLKQSRGRRRAETKHPK